MQRCLSRLRRFFCPSPGDACTITWDFRPESNSVFWERTFKEVACDLMRRRSLREEQASSYNIACTKARIKGWTTLVEAERSGWNSVSR
jgi:hypothetical protein